MSTGAVRAYARPWGPRKCSFRFLFIGANGGRSVVTQDARRRRNVITGMIPLWGSSGSDHSIARDHGCSVIVRVKRDA